MSPTDKGHNQPQGPTGPIEIKSGGAPAEALKVNAAWDAANTRSIVQVDRRSRHQKVTECVAREAPSRTYSMLGEAK